VSLFLSDDVLLTIEAAMYKGGFQQIGESVGDDSWDIFPVGKNFQTWIKSLGILITI